jgi:putative transposase
MVGDLSQRQMVTREHIKRNKHLNRAVFNDWGLYTFVQMLRYKCMLYGKEIVILDERDTSKTCCVCGNKQDMPLWKGTYRCINTTCRFVIDRDENSAVNILKRYLARLGPHTGDPVRCADVFIGATRSSEANESLGMEGEGNTWTTEYPMGGAIPPRQREC